ncbi:hypothetical protein HID58_000435 [Brassica napus]|uniref:Uncharacterized protein n=1 Tax=Brassica napus TaxID=3708 RepID=A0ABQ8EGJ9_BRANA|nr:hypothetical protein HID58_000435 [Brassica napus]
MGKSGHPISPHTDQPDTTENAVDLLCQDFTVPLPLPLLRLRNGIIYMQKMRDFSCASSCSFKITETRHFSLFTNIFRQTKLCSKAPPTKKILSIFQNRVGGSGVNMRSTAKGPYHCSVGADKSFGREGTSLILTSRNVCMPELTPVRINGEVMPGQFQVRPSVDLMCFALLCSGSNMGC